jgi:hypothetical protein
VSLVREVSSSVCNPEKLGRPRRVWKVLGAEEHVKNCNPRLYRAVFVVFSPNLFVFGVPFGTMRTQNSGLPPISHSSSSYCTNWSAIVFAVNTIRLVVEGNQSVSAGNLGEVASPVLHYSPIV